MNGLNFKRILVGWQEVSSKENEAVFSMSGSSSVCKVLMRRRAIYHLVPSVLKVRPFCLF